MAPIARQPRSRRTGSRRPRRVGFTLMELTLGMMVTTLVMGAVAAVVSAVAQGWEATGSKLTTASTTARVNVRVQSLLKSARQIGAVRTGSLSASNTLDLAAVLMWKGDANSDSQIQFSEIAMLAHEKYTNAKGEFKQELALYEVSFPSGWTAAQKAAADSVYTAADVKNAVVLGTFPTTEHVRRRAIADDVTGAQFCLVDSATAIRPIFDYVLKFNRAGSGGVVETAYGTAAVRSAVQ
jgi:hypothetical protein